MTYPPGHAPPDHKPFMALTPADPKTGRKRTLSLNLHEGQKKAWRSKKRFILILAGTQSGKTSFGPHWLWREIQQQGPGDYLVVAPTYPLLALKCLPEFLTLFEKYLGVGRYLSSPTRVFRFSDEGNERAYLTTKHIEEARNVPTNVYFGHAQDPDSLESATAKAAWLDEAGQKKFRSGSYEAVTRRLSIHQGRILLTTTPYSLGWLKRELYDPALAGDPTIELVSFESNMNPSFPKAEYDRMKEKLPVWKFNMMYRGRYDRPAGIIYDSFEEANHVRPRFHIPRDWKRHVGLDFGTINTAAVFFAEEPNTGKLYLYREYRPAGKRAVKEHVDAILAGEPGIPASVVGGAPSEDDWRDEFASMGLPVTRPPISDVELGIDRVYAAHLEDRIIVFSDCRGYIDEKLSYSRALDDDNQPTLAIDDKHRYHHLDAERYVIAHLADHENQVAWDLW